MKDFKKSFASLGANVLVSGSRKTNNDATLTATSTEGGFRISPIVSSILQIKSGDYMAFANNLAIIDEQFNLNSDLVKEAAVELGLELGSEELRSALHKEFDMWWIFKGIKELTANGVEKKINARVSRAEKLEFVKQNFEALKEQALAVNEEGVYVHAEVAEAISAAADDVDAVCEILMGLVVSPEVPKFKGSKAFNASGIQAIGTPLIFTDGAVWTTLKSDLGEKAASYSRVFELDKDDVQIIEVHNGYEVVKVPALVLGDIKDVESVKRKATATVNAANTTSVDVEEDNATDFED